MVIVTNRKEKYYGDFIVLANDVIHINPSVKVRCVISKEYAKRPRFLVY